MIKNKIHFTKYGKSIGRLPSLSDKLKVLNLVCYDLLSFFGLFESIKIGYFYLIFNKNFRC